MSKPSIESATPMMRQWFQCKEKTKDCLLLFRMGDFYEAFYEDAALLAEKLNLTLTKRQEIPMSGIPYHSLQNYLDRLLTQGLKVAIAEQTEDPKKTKGLVKREVTRIVTPGTLIDSNLLEDQTHNYCASISQIGSRFGLALVDVSTSNFLVSELNDLSHLYEELHRFQPAELVVTKSFFNSHKSDLEALKRSFSVSVSTIESWHFDAKRSLERLMNHFEVLSLDGFGLKGMSSAISASGALLSYLSEELCLKTEHIRSIQPIQDRDYLVLDHITLKHLEVLQPQNAQCSQTTLLSLLNQTHTAMGARLMREWIQKPLLNTQKIHERQDAIESFLKESSALSQTAALFGQISDLERIISRISTKFAHPKELLSLKQSLEKLAPLKEMLSLFNSPFIHSLKNQLIELPDLLKRVDTALNPEPPTKIGDGKTFKMGYHEKLDEWLLISRSSKEWIANYQARIRQETQIKTLKVGFNRVFGYYIEVSKGQSHLVPKTFHRRQTLANAERFISEELKTYETKVLQADEKIAALEVLLFEELRAYVAGFTTQILSLAQTIAHLDTLLALALVAKRYRYIKPLVDDSQVLKIDQGAHPILDRINSFVPNDTYLDDQDQRLALITGPNMAGKSTYIRQVALITLMAQIGSYVPAQSAHIGVVDRIFTRIGASDDLSRGQSTFMVEMVETANILNNVTNRSLVILDEIGRGTSTYDGIAIAQSTALHLLRMHAKTLFATHYSELTRLEEKYPGIINYTVCVHESQEEITFLYKITKGCTDKSYGIHVAKLAGLPLSLIQEATEILKTLEQAKLKKKSSKSLKEQLTFFEPKPQHLSPILSEIESLSLDQLTPIEALLKLKDYQKQLCHQTIQSH